MDKYGLSVFCYIAAPNVIISTGDKQKTDNGVTVVAASFFFTPSGLWFYYQEKPHFVKMCILSDCVSCPETSDVQEALWRNIKLSADEHVFQ